MPIRKGGAKRFKTEESFSLRMRMIFCFLKMRMFESVCQHCGGKTKVETRQGIVACATCGAEDSDHVPFYEEGFEKYRKTKLETTDESDCSED